MSGDRARDKAAPKPGGAAERAWGVQLGSVRPKSGPRTQHSERVGPLARSPARPDGLRPGKAHLERTPH